MLINTILKLSLLYAVFSTVQSARILGVFPFAAPSHYILGSALMRGLVEAGHNVTIVSPFEDKNPPKGGSYRDVVLTGFLEQHNKMMEKVDLLSNKNRSLISSFMTRINVMLKVNEDFFTVENVQNLLKPDEKFDVVIIEQFMTDSLKILGHIYNAPVIAFSSLGANPWVNNLVGNPSPLSYIPMLQSDFTPYMTFFERLKNVFMYLLNQAIDAFIALPAHRRSLEKLFDNPPDVQDLNHRVELVLLNSHESLNQAVPHVPNMVQIGGFHVKPPKKLPKDFQEYLDNAKEGVVYFSLGSNLKSKNLPPEKRDAILTAFGKLKQKVLWKWEEDDLPGKPDNVKLAKWLPQQDILAHPNVNLFITHSGLLSTTETVYHGVPILGIPVFGDQHQNAKLAVASGYALSLPYEDPSFSEEKLSELLHELLNNPKYTENVKRRSKLFHDRPMKPMETAVYWVEYIARNGGAHLRVAGVELPWYKYYLLDVISFLVILTLLVVSVIRICIRKIFRCLGICQKKQSKTKRD